MSDQIPAPTGGNADLGPVYSAPPTQFPPIAQELAQGVWPAPTPPKKSRVSTATIILGVTTSVLLLALIAASVVLVQTRGNLSDTKQTLASTQTDLSTATQQRDAAQQTAIKGQTCLSAVLSAASTAIDGSVYDLLDATSALRAAQPNCEAFGTEVNAFKSGTQAS